jgi:hypothetical protein
MELLIISALLVIAAETTYLVVAQTIKFKHSKKQHMPIFVDTSVLIDGRIISIAAHSSSPGVLSVNYNSWPTTLIPRSEVVLVTASILSKSFKQ